MYESIIFHKNTESAVRLKEIKKGVPRLRKFLITCCLLVVASWLVWIAVDQPALQKIPTGVLLQSIFFSSTHADQPRQASDKKSTIKKIENSDCDNPKSAARMNNPFADSGPCELTSRKKTLSDEDELADATMLEDRQTDNFKDAKLDRVGEEELYGKYKSSLSHSVLDFIENSGLNLHEARAECRKLSPQRMYSSDECKEFNELIPVAWEQMRYEAEKSGNAKAAFAILMGQAEAFEYIADYEFEKMKTSYLKYRGIAMLQNRNAIYDIDQHVKSVLNIRGFPSIKEIQ